MQIISSGSNIKAPLARICWILSHILRDKALSTVKGPTYQLIEVNFGSYPQDLETAHGLTKGRLTHCLDACGDRGRKRLKEPHRWQPEEVTWEAPASAPGWCKLDWVVADPVA